MSAIKSVTLSFLVIALPATARAGNPLIPHVYAADPSAHVWPGDDRLWLYTSDDRPETDTHDTMASYHVFSTANHPLGPYTFRGVFMGKFKKMAGTNHGSIIPNQGHWYFFYHSAWVSGGNSTARNLMADELFHDADGNIRRIEPTVEGVAVQGTPRAPSRVTMLLEAENGPPAGSIAVDYFKLEPVEAFPRFELN